MSELEALRRIVAEIGPEHIYRTIYDQELRVIHPGKEQIDEESLQAFGRVEFAGKTVVDLGCNFGFFTFYARKLGAASVLGVDRERRVLDGCRLLQRHFRADRVEFAAHDIDETDSPLLARRFDVAMLVEFIGKGLVNAGKVDAALRFLERLSDRELVVSVQKVYWINKELQTTPERLDRLYPGGYVTGGDFLLLDYVRDFFVPNWDMEILSDIRDGYEKPRKFLRFVRKAF